MFKFQALLLFNMKDPCCCSCSVNVVQTFRVEFAGTCEPASQEKMGGCGEFAASGASEAKICGFHVSDAEARARWGVGPHPGITSMWPPRACSTPSDARGGSHPGHARAGVMCPGVAARGGSPGALHGERGSFAHLIALSLHYEWRAPTSPPALSDACRSEGHS